MATSRRSILKGILGALALPLTGGAKAAEKLTYQGSEIIFDEGFTSYSGYYTLGPKAGSPFSEMIVKTLRDRAPLVAENITQNNALLTKLRSKRNAIKKVQV